MLREFFVRIVVYSIRCIAIAVVQLIAYLLKPHTRKLTYSRERKKLPTIVP